MPIDAGIYDQVKPPPSTLATLGDVARLREAQQTQQITALKLQQEQRAQQEQQLLDASYQKHVRPDGTIDYAGMASDVAASGHGHLAPGLLKSGMDVQKSMADAVEAQGKANDAQRNVAGSLGASMQDLLDHGAPPEYVANYGRAHVEALARSGLMAPQDQQGMTQALASSDPAALTRVISAMRAASKQQSELDTSRMNATTTAAKAAATIPGDVAESAVKQQVAAGTRGGLTPDQQATTAATAAARVETARHNRADEAAAGQRVALERQRLQADMQPFGAGSAASANMPDVPPGQKNDAFLQTLPPGIQTQVKMLAEGKLNVPAFALKTPYWQNLLQAAAKYDPTFDTVNYNARSKTRADFTSGKSAQQVNAINTVIGHLDNLSDAAEKLNNSSIPLVNRVTNFASQATGSPTVTNFNTIRKAVSDEVTRVWRQAGGSEKDIEAAQANLDAAGSPDQLRGAIATYGDLLKSKLDSLNEQYRQGMGTDKIDMVTPKAQQTLQKIEQRAGKASAGVTVTAPNGKVYPFADQAKADAFVADAKAKGLWK